MLLWRAAVKYITLWFQQHNYCNVMVCSTQEKYIRISQVTLYNRMQKPLCCIICLQLLTHNRVIVSRQCLQGKVTYMEWSWRIL